MKAAQLAYLRHQFHADKQLTLLTLHGMMGSKTNFRSIVKHPKVSNHLKEAFLLDLRNHGESEHLDSMTFPELALDLKHFIDLHSLSNLVLMGHSFGARNLWAYLLEHKQHAEQHVRGVIIVDILPTVITSMTPDLLVKLLKIPLKQRQYAILKKEVEEASGSAAVGALVFSNLKCLDEQIDSKKLQDYEWRNNLKAILASFDYNMNYEFKMQWEGPAKVICGELSEFVKEEDRRKFLQVFPSLDIQRDIIFVQGSGHWVHAEKPKEFIETVSDFLIKL